MNISDRAFKIAKAYTDNIDKKSWDRNPTFTLRRLIDQFGRIVYTDAMRTLGCQCGQYKSTAFLTLYEWQKYTWDCHLHGQVVDRFHYIYQMNQFHYLKQNFKSIIVAVIGFLVLVDIGLFWALRK